MTKLKIDPRDREWLATVDAGVYRAGGSSLFDLVIAARRSDGSILALARSEYRIESLAEVAKERDQLREDVERCALVGWYGLVEAERKNAHQSAAAASALSEERWRAVARAEQSEARVAELEAEVERLREVVLRFGHRLAFDGAGNAPSTSINGTDLALCRATLARQAPGEVPR